jgi:hypothetical protein
MVEKLKNLEISQEKKELSVNSLDIPNSSEEINEIIGEDKATPNKKPQENKSHKTPKTKIIKKKEIFRPLPSHNVMRRKVINKLENKLKNRIKNLKKYEKKAYFYVEEVKKIRSLKQEIKNFIKASLNKIKEVYLKYFGLKHGIKKDKN